MKRVLIITYYWPPSGGSGVQRWLKMSKYLPDMGWQPVIYTADGAEYPVEDKSLENDVNPSCEVIRQPIVEPYSFYKKFLGIKKEERVKAGFISEKKKTSFKEKLAVWVRGNFFIPDARCWWVKPSVRYLKNYLKEHPVDAIISTGPPHSMHLIAQKLHATTGIPWVADFRDPWTDIDFYQDLHLTHFADKKHHRLEKKVLTEATEVVAVGHEMAQSLEKKALRKVQVIENGFDFDLKNEGNDKKSFLSNSKFVITYAGIINKDRNAVVFWRALSELCAENASFADDLSLRLIGHIDNSVVEALKENGLEQKTEVVPYIPHSEIQAEQKSAALLLLLVNNTPNAKGILTGKLFEYLAAERPIFAVGPEDGDTATILKETQQGTIVDFNDKEKMKNALSDYYNLFKTGRLTTEISPLVENFSRKNLAHRFVELLNKIC